MTLANSYLTPREFVDFYRNEEEEGEQVPSVPIKALNYLLIKEVFKVSPMGKVNSLVYKLSTARVSIAFGMDNIKNIYNKGLSEIKDKEFYLYRRLMVTQILKANERFVGELPALESVIRCGEDLSEVSVKFWDFSLDGRKELAPYELYP